MMDMISVIRQMMADSKLTEAQKAAENIFCGNNSVLKDQILPLYLDILLAQNKRPSSDLIIEMAERYLERDISKVEYWVSQFPQQELNRHFIKFQKIQIYIAEARGKTEELYQKLSAFQIYLFTSKVPVLHDFVYALTKKYFPQDFNLALQRLCLEIMTGDYQSAETTTRNLMRSCFEQSFPKSTSIKFGLIVDILETKKLSCSLDIYKNLCSLFTRQTLNKNDYKKLAEAIIYFDDFQFQTIILELLNALKLNGLVTEYAKVVSENKDYNFVYFDKFFPRLKYLFVVLVTPVVPMPPTSILTVEDLRLNGTKSITKIEMTSAIEQLDEESHFVNLLTFQEFPLNELLDIATSFLQSRMPRVALKASDLALKVASDTDNYLKSAYLKLMSLLQLNDYRAALDLSIEAVGRAIEADDRLSFLYVQAELFIKLNQKNAARSILEKIQSIDADYRLTKERLVKLNEI